MVWHVSDLPAAPRLPDGYQLRLAQPEDGPAFEELHSLAWPYEYPLQTFLEIALPGGFFVVEHDASGLLVSSCIASRPGVWKDYPDTGSLGWLVTDPVHQGIGLATSIVLAVMNRLAAEGYETVYLSTEDERLAAIHIYLKLGWQPLIYTEGMGERWEGIHEALGARDSRIHTADTAGEQT